MHLDGKRRGPFGFLFACELIALVCLGLGCGAHTSTPIPANPVKLPIPFHAEGKLYRLDVVIGSADVEPRETTALLLKDSILVEVMGSDGRKLARVRANAGISLPPYSVVSLQEFIWECEDSSVIAGQELIWDQDADPSIHIPGQFELTTKMGLVMGEGLEGDLLLRRYEILRVSSAVSWDDLVGDSLQMPQ